MSAFIVDADTINRIVTFLSEDREFAPWYGGRLAVHGFGTSRESLQEFGLALLNLNIQAVRARYPGEPDSDLPGPINPGLFAFRPIPASKVQVLKSLSCWLYQCSEGDIPESPLYRLMETLKGDLAESIVSRLPEYDQAVWG